MLNGQSRPSKYTSIYMLNHERLWQLDTSARGGRPWEWRRSGNLEFLRWCPCVAGRDARHVVVKLQVLTRVSDAATGNGDELSGTLQGENFAPPALFVCGPAQRMFPLILLKFSTHLLFCYLSEPSPCRSTHPQMFCALLILSALFFALAFAVGLPMIYIRPQKFALSFTCGSLTFMGSFAILKGPYEHLMGMLVPDRLPFTAVYVGSMMATLFFTFTAGGATGYVIVLGCSAAQLLALMWYLITFLPGGAAGMQMLSAAIYTLLKPVAVACTRCWATIMTKVLGRVTGISGWVWENWVWTEYCPCSWRSVLWSNTESKNRFALKMQNNFQRYRCYVKKITTSQPLDSFTRMYFLDLSGKRRSSRTQKGT